MAQSSIFHTSGLERDYRQDEFPTRQDELFPTMQDEFPTAYIPNDGQVLHYEDRSTFHPSGLERDCRQDKFPTRLDEFPTIEDEFPTAYIPNNAQVLHYEDPHVISEINPDLPLTLHQQQQPAIESQSRLCGLRETTFWLVLILLVFIVFGAVGAVVHGLRMKRSEKQRCVNYYCIVLYCSQVK